MDFRVGQGYDAHRLTAQRPLIIGGIHIPYPLGLLGHSDADVLIHAIIDAILGAAGMGDIGEHFPESDERYKGVASMALLEEVLNKIWVNWQIINVDATIIAERPKFSPYKEEMALNIARTLNISPDCINIKATTEEKMGFTGKSEGIAVHAVCLIKRRDGKR